MILGLKVSFFALVACQSVANQKLHTDMWAQVEPRVVQMRQQGAAKGFAMLVHDSGLFVAHESAIPAGIVTGNVQGREISFRVVSRDARSQLALLATDNWDARIRPLKLAPENPKKGSRLIAVTLEGLYSAELAADDSVGLQNDTGRYVPFNEVRIETPTRRLGGAWMLNEKGEIVGVIGAALQNMQANVQRAPGNASSMKADYGPGDLLVAYSLPTDVLSRVTTGFLSPSHQPKHPELGIEFVDNRGPGGALVRSIVIGSSVQKAGLQIGDVIVAVDGRSTNRATQLAAQLFRLTPGETVTITIQRGKDKREIKAQVGEAASTFQPKKLGVGSNLLVAASFDR